MHICYSKFFFKIVTWSDYSAEFVFVFFSADPLQPSMQRVIVWSILVTSVIATDGSGDLRDSGAETKGPGCKPQFLYNKLNI